MALLLLSAMIFSACLIRPGKQTSTAEPSGQTAETEETSANPPETSEEETTAPATEPPTEAPSEETTEAPTETEAPFLPSGPLAAEALAASENLNTGLPVLYLSGDLERLIYSSKYTTGDFQYELLDPAGEEEYFGKATVRGHGNSSWKRDKKSFNLRLEAAQDLFGMGKSKKWVLLCNRDDGSFLRNKLSYDLSGVFGLEPIQGRFVELVVNGRSYGNYYLCEKVGVGKNRVEIETIEGFAEDFAEIFAEKNQHDPNLSWITEDALKDRMEQDLSWVSSLTVNFNGVNIVLNDYVEVTEEELLKLGYLLEIEGFPDLPSLFHTPLQRPVMVRDPENACTNAAVFSAIQEYVAAFDNALISPDHTVVYQGETLSTWDICDIDTAAAYWWTQEVFYNLDAYYRSGYFYKAEDRDGERGKLYFEPIWDMDYSSNGMRDSGADYPVEGWACRNVTPFNQQATSYGRYLIRDREFALTLYRSWRANREQVLAMIDSIDGEASYIRASIDNDARIFGIFRYDFDTEVNRLKSWLQKRVAWIDAVTSDFENFWYSLN